jgi:hypothetical protein
LARSLVGEAEAGSSRKGDASGGVGKDGKLRCDVFRINIEVLQLLYSEFIIRLAFITKYNRLVVWDICFLVLGREVILASEDEERRD